MLLSTHTRIMSDARHRFKSNCGLRRLAVASIKRAPACVKLGERTSTLDGVKPLAGFVFIASYSRGKTKPGSSLEHQEAAKGRGSGRSRARIKRAPCKQQQWDDESAFDCFILRSDAIRRPIIRVLRSIMRSSTTRRVKSGERAQVVK